MVHGLPDYHGYFISVPLPPTEAIQNPKKYEGTVATAGVPVTLDINTDLGRNAGTGYIINDGPGDLQIDISYNGVTFETDITVKPDEILSLDGLNIDSIKIDATVNATAYRVLVA